MTLFAISFPMTSREEVVTVVGLAVMLRSKIKVSCMRRNG
jgi:hypothetical protein